MATRPEEGGGRQAGPENQLCIYLNAVAWDKKIYELAVIMSEGDSAEPANLTVAAASGRGILPPL